MEAALVAGEAWPTLEGVPREVTSVFATDFEGDGRAELVLNLTQDLYAPTRHRSGSWIARREGDARWTVSRNPDEVGMCRTAADLDDDGDPDLVCVGRAARVMWNEQGRFDVGRSTPLALRGAAMAAMAWDLDRDGLLDLVVSHWEGATLQVFQNLGGGRFDDVSTTWGLSVDGMTWCTGIVDFDDDGGEDLYVVGDGAAHENLALRNTGPAPDGSPRFARVTPSGDPRQAARWFGTSDAGPMGLAFGWIDDDDRPDLVVASDLFSGPGLRAERAHARRLPVDLRAVPPRHRGLRHGCADDPVVAADLGLRPRRPRRPAGPLRRRPRARRRSPSRGLARVGPPRRRRRRAPRYRRASPDARALHDALARRPRRRR
ncbi:MAG: FG-GAP-like repeat-containing protein [Polyangiales bacterium]